MVPSCPVLGDAIKSCKDQLGLTAWICKAISVPCVFYGLLMALVFLFCVVVELAGCLASAGLGLSVSEARMYDHVGRPV